MPANIRRARTDRGWSQGELADRLTLCTNRSWSNVSVSAAEASWSGSGERTRSFDIDDLMAFSLALKVPPMWFFLPPETTPRGEEIEPETLQITFAKSDPDRQICYIDATQLARLATMTDDPGDKDALWAQRLHADQVGESAVGHAVALMDSSQVRDLYVLVERLLKVINADGRASS